MTAVAYVGLGSNMGDRQAYISAALAAMHQLPDTAVIRVSALYETAPWGKEDQAAFLNCAAAIRTALEPVELLRQLLNIEVCLGRRRVEHWGPRVIDLDLLLYDQAIMQSAELILPHPLITARAFVLIPLAEISPELVIGERNVSEHLAALTAKRTPGDVAYWGPPPALA